MRLVDLDVATGLVAPADDLSYDTQALLNVCLGPGNSSRHGIRGCTSAGWGLLLREFATSLVSPPLANPRPGCLSRLLGSPGGWPPESKDRSCNTSMRVNSAPQAASTISRGRMPWFTGQEKPASLGEAQRANTCLRERSLLLLLPAWLQICVPTGSNSTCAGG